MQIARARKLGPRRTFKVAPNVKQNFATAFAVFCTLALTRAIWGLYSGGAPLLFFSPISQRLRNPDSLSLSFLARDKEVISPFTWTTTTCELSLGEESLACLPLLVSKFTRLRCEHRGRLLHMQYIQGP